MSPVPLPLWRRRHWRNALLCLVMLLLFLYAATTFRIGRKLHHLKEINTSKSRDVPDLGLVMATRRAEDISWILELTPQWRPYIYSGAEPPEPGYHPLPSLRGREAMAYVTFIIDNYDKLPTITAFVHAGATQFHNDVLGPYTADLLRNLRLENVIRSGYANLRCSHEPGCPISVNPLNPTPQDIEQQGVRAHFPDVYMTLFGANRSAVPDHIGGACCAQFVVSAERIRARPRTDYIRMRDWMINGSLDIANSYEVGWVFEELWHVVFGMGDIHCPSFEQCRCDLVGWCNETIPDELKPYVKSAHPWLGRILGERFGNNNAVGAPEIL